MSNTELAVSIKTLLLFALVVAPDLSVGASVGTADTALAATRVFKAGSYLHRSATLASLSKGELRFATKQDNIEGLITLARAERRWNLNHAAELHAWERYNSIREGDLLLLQCLKEPRCDPDKIADIAMLSDLHREVVLRRPASNLTQVNHVVGEISELVMLRYFESTGWTKIEGQVGRSGIDGLFVKRNTRGVVREVMIVESKYNTSALQTTNHGQQMSRDWLQKKLSNLRQHQPDESTYRRVEELLSAGYYRARLWTMRVEEGEIRINFQRVRSSSDRVDELIEDPGTRVAVPPSTIRLSSPANKFEKTIADAYVHALQRLELPP